jgi:hypothetical protein
MRNTTHHLPLIGQDLRRFIQNNKTAYMQKHQPASRARMLWRIGEKIVNKQSNTMIHYREETITRVLTALENNLGDNNGANNDMC